MLPKEYYDQYTIPQENNYVFALFPSELEKQYLKHIKEPLELIVTDEGNVICQSYLDFSVGSQVMQEIWKGIAKANVVIADITHFKPNVMFELGVALMDKESVYIVANEKLNSVTQKNLPYDLSQIKVQFYNENSLDKLSSGLVNYIESKIDNIETPWISNAEVARLMIDAKDLISSNRVKTALLLFGEMDSKEPNNWYVHREWGNAFVKMKDYKKANEKYLSAIEYGRSDRHKALVYIEMAQMHRMNKQENNALVAFSKAENLDRNNADLYEKWGYMYHIIGNRQEAMNKMLIAVKLKSTKEYRLKAQYYTKRVIEPDFHMKLGMWLKRQEQNNNQKQNYNVHVRNAPKHIDKNKVKANYNDNEKEISYSKFIKQCGIGSTLSGKITNIDSRLGVFVRFDESGATGLIHRSVLPKFYDMTDDYKIDKTVKVKVIGLIDAKHNIKLELA